MKTTLKDADPLTTADNDIQCKYCKKSIKPKRYIKKVVYCNPECFQADKRSERMKRLKAAIDYLQKKQ